jgi:hypothetical protein
MLTALMVAYEYPYTLIVAPAFVIFLAVTLSIILKAPSLKGLLGVFLVLVGLGEIFFSIFFMFGWGNLIGLATAAVGFFIVISSGTNFRGKLALEGIQLNLQKTRVLKRTVYLLYVIVILASSELISARITNIIHEQHLENFDYANSPNLTVKGTINSVKLNYEVNNGFSYHIFPAYLSLEISEVIWNDQPWENQTAAVEYFLHQGSTVVCFEKSDVPSLVAGQQVEVSGYYCLWIEDSLYSSTLVVSPYINGSYLSPL